jgi:hypothetical protein
LPRYRHERLAALFGMKTRLSSKAMRLRVLPLLLICGFGLPLAPKAASVLIAGPAMAAGSVDQGDGWLQQDDDGPPGAVLRFPGMPPIRIGPDGRIIRNDAPQFPPVKRQALKPSLSPAQRAAAAKAEALKRAMAPQKTHAALRAELLDTLFDRLRKATDTGDANGIAGAIERVWLHTDSPTANLLMARADAALQAGHLPLALTLFDKIVILQPNWAEAWQKRASTRLIGGDLDGAVSDMHQVLKLDPRQFSALAALGFALQRQGLDRQALAAFRKSLALDPQQPEIKEIVDKLSVKVEGRDI